MANREKTFDELETEQMEKAPTLLITLVDRRPSGFIKDHDNRPAGSWGTEHFHELDAPVARFIPNFGYRQAFKEEMRGGKKVKTPYNEPIRYIKEQTEISEAKQKELGIQRSRATKEDLIEIKRGDFSVVREGSYIGLYDYLEQVFYNEGAEGRSARATAIFKVVQLGKEEEQINEHDIAMADALKFIAQFYKKGVKGYIYQQEKIDSLCNIFEVYAETPSGKITALNGLAKHDPKAFMEKALKFEQGNYALVATALHLNVAKFDGNIFSYTEKEKIILHLGNENFISNQSKIERTAQLLQTADFAGAWQELQLEVEIAQERQLNA